MIEEIEDHDNYDELHAWIDTIPFSKPKKNLTRDFSDAVLVAELLKFYYPRYVELHNYVPANNINTKKDNWQTLNRKVLAKIDIKLTKDTISQLANAHESTIRKLLSDLKAKISNHTPNNHESENKDCGIEDDEEGDKAMQNLENTEITTGTTKQSTDAVQNVAIKDSVPQKFKRGVLISAEWLFRLICFWNILISIWRYLFRVFAKEKKVVVDASTEQLTPVSVETNEVVPRILCTQLKQEVREKNDIICTLNHKVAYLESAMKLKDLRISNLTSQVVQNAVMMDQLKSQSCGTNQTKQRVRPLSVQEKST